MDTFCPPRATSGAAEARRRRLRPAALLLGLLLSLPALAAGNDQTTGWTPPIAGFDAGYRFKIAGFPFSIEARRTLKPMGDGVWQMQVRASNFIGEIRETSLFRWRGCNPVTTFYGYRRQGLGQLKTAQVHIDRETRVATSERSEHQPATFKVAENTTDKISVALALQCKLARGDNDLSVPVADERGLEQERYVMDGKETLKIDGHAIDTVRLHRVRGAHSDRDTWLWFAPKRDYTLVQLVQENDDGRHVMTLEEP